MDFWYRLSAVFNLLGIQLLRTIFELFRIIGLVILSIPMILSSKAFDAFKDTFWKEFAELEKDENEEHNG